MSTRVWHRMAIAILSLGLWWLSAQAQTVGPLANTTVGNARLIVPDGSSLRQSISSGETRWFVFGAEPGKTYVVEAVDPESDLVSNTIGALHVYAANGTTTPPPETNVDCTASNRAPAMELPVAVSGMRCVVRAFPPTQGNTQNKRGLYVAVGLVDGSSFDIRVRESTIYGRWTTNGYDFHVELQNTTADSMCAQVMLLPNSGNTYAGTWSGAVTTQQLTIPAFGANKLVFPNGTLVGSDFRGTLRIGACASPTNFVPTALHVSTYAYNPLTDRFLYFFTTPANNGATANSWSAASGGAANAFVQGGNAFGTTAVLGTTDNNAVEIKVDGSRAMRYEPNATSPNVIGGHVNDGVYVGVVGASIAGGGAAGAQNVPLLGRPCTLAYGCLNGVTDAFGTIGGGAGNQAGDGVGSTSDAAFATVAGGFSNWAVGEESSVGGGSNNAATQAGATVAGGLNNTASGFSATVAGGIGNTASGYDATVPGGGGNMAAGDYSFAAGYLAKIPASAPGSFLWADSGGATLPAGAHDVFVAVATNGIGFYTYSDFSHGCALLGLAGSWSCTSDRATKADFTVIEPRDILARLVEMPITQWRWKGEAETVRHVGPTAQDFRAAFGLGYGDKTITLVDTEGVALAAIQGLNAKVEEQQREIEDLRERVSAAESVRRELAALRAELADLREIRTQTSARAPAAVDTFRADAAR